jgi:hypothetical protein
MEIAHLQMHKKTNKILSHFEDKFATIKKAIKTTNPRCLMLICSI